MKKYLNLVTHPRRAIFLIKRQPDTAIWRKLFIPLLLIFSLSSISTTTVKAQSPYAIMVEINHVCGKNLGSVGFALTGDPNDYTYYWEHGPTELFLYDLEPGFYTLIVENAAGCKEEFEVEILDLNDCFMKWEVVIDPKRKCWPIITITVMSNGVPVNPASLNVEWSDQYLGGLNRPYFSGKPFDACVKITPSNSEPEPTPFCCVLEECFNFEPNKDCERRVISNGPIVVNEFNKGDEKQPKFIELLVTGEGDCGNFSDIRGFHVDDNNGLLIPANDLVNQYLIGDIGIDPGFLSFRQHDNWKEVPNGSLILIYTGEKPTEQGLPENDPTDADGDGVYVLTAENAELFRGKSSEWNSITNVSPYEGYFVNPSWDLVDISEKADGIQVRFPDGEYSHGVSYGETNFSGENNFPLWITDNDLSSCNCSAMGSSFLEKEEFACIESNGDVPTPGKANSIENAETIYYLKDCEEKVDSRDNNDLVAARTINENELLVYPNPFQDEISLEFQAQTSGEVSLVLYSIDGSQLTQRSWTCEKGTNTYQFKPEIHLPSGVLILQFTFPEGERKDVRITRIH